MHYANLAVHAILFVTIMKSKWITCLFRIYNYSSIYWILRIIFTLRLSLANIDEINVRIFFQTEDVNRVLEKLVIFCFKIKKDLTYSNILLHNCAD